MKMIADKRKDIKQNSLFKKIENEINKKDNLHMYLEQQTDSTCFGTTRMWLNETINTLDKELNELRKLIHDKTSDFSEIENCSFDNTAFPMIGKPKDNLINELIVVLYKKFTSYQASGVYCTKSKGYQAGWHDAFELVKQILENELDYDK